MSRKVTWTDPTEIAVTNVEVSKSPTQYGSYTVSTTMDATSDGNPKTSANTWVTNYTDSAGLVTEWYKIRFYDGTYYSEFSEPVTSEERVNLCTVADIKGIIDTVGRWSDDEVFDAITEVDELIYTEGGKPLQAITSPVGTINSVDQDLYYVGEPNIYRIDRVFYGTATKEELQLGDEYNVNERQGMIKLITTGTYAVTLDTDKIVEIEYVPNLYHKLSIYRTCKLLLEQLDMISSGKPSKELGTIAMRLKSVEQILMNRIGLELSSNYKNYDKYYGINMKTMRQDHDRNRYLASTSNEGW